MTLFTFTHALHILTCMYDLHLYLCKLHISLLDFYSYRDFMENFQSHVFYVISLQYTVTLQTEEVISRHCLSDSTSNLVHRSALCCYEECCYISTKSNFILHIPVTATPEFTHKIGKRLQHVLPLHTEGVTYIKRKAVVCIMSICNRQRNVNV